MKEPRAAVKTGEQLGVQRLSHGHFKINYGESGDGTGYLVVTRQPLSPVSYSRLINNTLKTKVN